MTRLSQLPRKSIEYAQARLARFFRSLFPDDGSQPFSELDLLKQHLLRPLGRPGVMIDVGAHFGESFDAFEQNGWQVYAFEPDSNNRAKIRTNSKTLRLFEFAVSDQSGLELEFYTSDESTGISGLIAFHPTHQSTFQVKTITLRDVAEQESIDAVDFLKIDTEGNDLLVLKGFPFERFKPQAILCEFEDAKTRHLDYDFVDLGKYLLDQGYDVYLSEWEPIVKYGMQHTWHSIRPFEPSMELVNEKGWGNFLAIHPSQTKRFQRVLEKYLARRR